MLDMGFLPDIRRVLRHIPKKRQTLFFSATMPPPIAELTREMLHDPVTINLERRSAPATGITPAMAPLAGSAKIRGRLTMRAFWGAASGIWMTSMLNSAVFGSSFGSLPEHSASSCADRTAPVPDP